MSEENLRVLIADDEPLIRMDLKELLIESGFDVVAEAKDGLEAVEFAKEYDPDLIFLDIKMPNMNGIEAANKIQDELARRLPIIMLTAYSQPDLYQEASEAGIFAYLTKPLRKSDLNPAIQVAMARAAEVDALFGEVVDLEEKLETRKLAERAKGILMVKLGLDEINAMKNLQKASMNQRVTIKEVAEAIIASE